MSLTPRWLCWTMIHRRDCRQRLWYSQSYDSAVEKVMRWFVKSKNMVEVLLLKFTAKNSPVDPACFLEVYRSHIVAEDGEGDYLEFEPDSDSSDHRLLEQNESYSDLFGSENIPEGKSADEEELLDLDMLRREVRNVLRQMERHVEEESAWLEGRRWEAREEVNSGEELEV